MNLLDLLILIPVIWGCIRGFSKGLILELATLLGMVLGIMAAYFFYPRVSSTLGDYFTLGSSALKILSYALIFLAVLLVSWIAGKILTRVAGVVMLGWLNKLLGGIFGLAKGVIVAALLLLIVVFFDKNEKLITRQAKEKSMFYDALKRVVPDYIIRADNREDGMI